MTILDWSEAVFMVIIVAIGLGGFIWAATKKD
jgi:nitrogen fixation-related uncharacterized protein